MQIKITSIWSQHKYKNESSIWESSNIFHILWLLNPLLFHRDSTITRNENEFCDFDKYSDMQSWFVSTVLFEKYINIVLLVSSLEKCGYLSLAL